MREQFEKLPEIKKRLISVKFDEALNRYESKNPVLIECFEVALFLNGAWYAYQEQQKKIEALIQSWNEKGMRGCSDYAMGAMHSLQNCTDELSKTMMGQEYNPLKGMDEFFDALQVKLENRP